MIKHILVGFDNSEESRRAVQWAIELAEQTSARLDVVAVARPPEIADDVETEALIERIRKQHRHDLAELRAATGDKIHTHVLVGHPAEQLLRYAEEHDVDHIVVGHRSRYAVQRWWLGSVSRQISDHAKCSVTIVRSAK